MNTKDQNRHPPGPLPLESLLAAPLNATLVAQGALVEEQVAFFRRVSGGGEKGSLRIPVHGDREVEAPLLALLPLPNLLVQRLEVNFSVELHEARAPKLGQSKGPQSVMHDEARDGVRFSGALCPHREHRRPTSRLPSMELRLVADLEVTSEMMMKVVERITKRYDVGFGQPVGHLHSARTEK